MRKDFVLSSLQLHHLNFSTNISQFQHFLPSPSPLYPNPLTQSSVNTQLPYTPLYPIPHTNCRQHTIPQLPFNQSPQNNLRSIHNPPTPFPLYPIHPTQSAVNTQFPFTQSTQHNLLSTHNHSLPNPHNTICCQHTIPPLHNAPTQSL